MSVPVLVLASASPRRYELLSRVGLVPHVHPAHLDESRLRGEDPRAYVERVAGSKALAVAEHHPAAVVLAADTTVTLGSEVLGKPRDREDARRMLRLLSGRSHEVLTAVAVRRGTDPSAGVTGLVGAATVTFRRLGEAEVEWYLATGEPSDAAGAWKIQGAGAALVTRLEGDPTAVVGLPLAGTLDLLRAAGVVWPPTVQR